MVSYLHHYSTSRLSVYPSGTTLDAVEDRNGYQLRGLEVLRQLLTLRRSQLQDKGRAKSYQSRGHLKLEPTI